MTEEERLAKNDRIREQGRLTRQKRTNQVCKVYRVKIDFSHLNAAQRLRLKMLFVEAKRLYNDALTFMQTHSISDYDPATRRVHVLDKDRQPVTHEIHYLSSQMRQSVIAGIKHSLKALASAKQLGRKVGGLKYKSDYSSIDLQQAGVTYRFYDSKHIGLQGFKKRLRVSGAEQFINEGGVELANAKLLNLPDGYYLAVTTFRDKGGKTSEYKPAIGIDMGIKTSITTSEREKYTVLVEETERLKKLQRELMRKKKGSSNRYRTRQLLRREYQKLDNRKRDAAAKIVHELLQHEKVYMQDENISGWHKGLLSTALSAAD